jgi:tyrosinase
MAIRQDQSTLTDTEKTQFVSAILGLKQSPSMLHPGAGNYSRYDDYVEVHVKAMMAMPDGWAHQGPAFFPWHRVLLLQFERDLQQMPVPPDGRPNPNLGIPYWDWIKNPALPAFLGGDGKADKQYEVTVGPFTRDKWTFNVVDGPGAATFLQRRFGWNRDQNGALIAITLPDAKAQDAELTVRWYDNVPWDVTAPRSSSFRQSAEGPLHNLVHRWVGGSWGPDDNPLFGTMMQMSSPNDPVFWLHHCNLDRLWSAWQAQPSAGAAFLPQGGAAPGHNLHDTLRFGDPIPWINTYTPAMVTDTYALGYSYDSLQQLSTQPAARARVDRLPVMRRGRRDPRRLFPLSSDL